MNDMMSEIEKVVVILKNKSLTEEEGAEILLSLSDVAKSIALHGELIGRYRQKFIIADEQLIIGFGYVFSIEQLLLSSNIIRKNIKKTHIGSSFFYAK